MGEKPATEGAVRRGCFLKNKLRELGRMRRAQVLRLAERGGGSGSWRTVRTALVTIGNMQALGRLWQRVPSAAGGSPTACAGVWAPYRGR